MTEANHQDIKPMYWSVRRELWENRSIIVGPLAVATFVLFGFWMSTFGMPHRRRALLLLDEAHQRAAIQEPFDVAAMMIMATAFLVGVFYSLDALYGERRDRTILFWKSLPVSDRTTVLSKASIPLVVLPGYIFALILTKQLMMLLSSSAILLCSGLSAAPQCKFFPSPFVMLYCLIVLALWHAPLYSWLLLVSGWAKRATFLWAVLPFIAVSFFEEIAFKTHHVAKLLGYRVAGGIQEAFVFPAKGQVPYDPTPHLTPGRFFTSSGLWLGLLFAAAFLAAAVRLRRYRDPI